MNALRRVLGFASAPTAVPPPASPERQRLREALAAQAEAKDNLHGAAEAVERVRQLMLDADTAEDDAEAAETAAIAATQAWASSGAKKDAAPGDKLLLNKAADSKRRASEARLMAEGARNGMPHIESAALDTRIALTSAAEEIKSAIAAVMLAEIGPRFEALERARGEYADALAEIGAIHLLVNAGSLHQRAGGPAHPYYEFKSDTAAATIAQRLLENEIQKPGDSELRQRAGSWVDFARRLATDPDGLP